MTKKATVRHFCLGLVGLVSPQVHYKTDIIAFAEPMGQAEKRPRASRRPRSRRREAFVVSAAGVHAWRSPLAQTPQCLSQDPRIVPMGERRNPLLRRDLACSCRGPCRGWGGLGPVRPPRQQEASGVLATAARAGLCPTVRKHVLRIELGSLPGVLQRETPARSGPDPARLPRFWRLPFDTWGHGNIDSGNPCNGYCCWPLAASGSRRRQMSLSCRE